ncbi:uncharacterized protein METZ01_LOCUS131792 [marine metagenome]|uniref:Uncharacterized protein n=1 Tax=marine metagenome TaxID=408172 RepID=A0A381YPI4_9ZZZZ
MILPERCWRKSMAACLTMVKVPFKCTAITESHSSSVILKIIRSLKTPAHVTTISSFPKVSIAC